MKTGLSDSYKVCLTVLKVFYKNRNHVLSNIKTIRNYVASINDLPHIILSEILACPYRWDYFWKCEFDTDVKIK